MKTDIVVIGSGPAGIQAAIHASRKKVDTVLVGKMNNSAAYGTDIENYFGLSGASQGTELLKNGLEQVETFGCKVFQMNVLGLSKDADGFHVELESGEDIVCKALVLATGITRVKLGVPGENTFGNGKGVSYCASCDCNFYKGKVVIIVGGQSESAVSAELMTRYASKVYWISPVFDADPSLVRKALDAGVETIEAGIEEILGETKVTSVRLSDGRIVETDGVFIELGGKSSVDLAMDVDLMPEMDDTIKVDRKCKTAVEGVFACGDVTGRPWQIAKAVGEGAVAGLSAAEYCRS
ncbi:MAG: NAD(P)/FAD-dependent oxidoreductase [archaeon]|nr:NAD(P)/FAD-dependent oxidoreductase [archaeon]